MKGTSNDTLRLSILAALSLTATAPVSAQTGAGASTAAPSSNTQGTAAQATATQGIVAQNAPAQEGTAAQGTAQPPAAAPAANQQTNLDAIVVTGVTSQRTVFNSSVDVTPISEAQIDQKAPRSTADVLELIPGVFVESTAGPVSNNYSVRGLPGGGRPSSSCRKTACRSSTAAAATMSIFRTTSASITSKRCKAAVPPSWGRTARACR